VVHFDLPGMKGINGLRRLCETWPSVHMLVTADGCDRDTVLEILSAGSHGFIPKSSSTAELEQALKATAAGHIYVLPTSVDRNFRRHGQSACERCVPSPGCPQSGQCCDSPFGAVGASGSREMKLKMRKNALAQKKPA
jgi:DNA-binding NarL/FixJ family response regulator